jgi:hypothetical protein
MNQPVYRCIRATAGAARHQAARRQKRRFIDGWLSETASQEGDAIRSPRQHASLEPISKSFEEDDDAGKLDKAEEVVGVVLPANEDPALPLNPGEEALDEPPSHVAA